MQEPAFPDGGMYYGMTLRDYFAAKAMQGLLANPKLPPEIVKSAYGWADAMMEARK